MGFHAKSREHWKMDSIFKAVTWKRYWVVLARRAGINDCHTPISINNKTTVRACGKVPQNSLPYVACPGPAVGLHTLDPCEGFGGGKSIVNDDCTFRIEAFQRIFNVEPCLLGMMIAIHENQVESSLIGAKKVITSA